MISILTYVESRHKKILSFSVSQFPQSSYEYYPVGCRRRSRQNGSNMQHVCCGLSANCALGYTTEGCGGQAQQQFSPFHSITSSARASSEGGTVRPRAFAVFRLMTSSNFFGCSIGRSA